MSPTIGSDEVRMSLWAFLMVMSASSENYLSVWESLADYDDDDSNEDSGWSNVDVDDNGEPIWNVADLDEDDWGDDDYTWFSHNVYD